jgi:CheY-like chemotaxis protein
MDIQMPGLNGLEATKKLREEGITTPIAALTAYAMAKSRKNSIVPMSKEASKLLVDVQVTAPEGHPYVFVSEERLRRITQRRKGGKWNSRSQVIKLDSMKIVSEYIF